MTISPEYAEELGRQIDELEAENERLREALEECIQTLAMAERPAPTQAEQHPVAWQWWYDRLSKWCSLANDTPECRASLEKEGYRLRPLYIAQPPAAPVETERDRCIAICEGWTERFEEGTEIQYTSAREYACDAINDIIDLIRDGKWPGEA